MSVLVVFFLMLLWVIVAHAIARIAEPKSRAGSRAARDGRYCRAHGRARRRWARAIMLLAAFLALPASAETTIRESIPGAVDKTLEHLGELDANDPEIIQLKRRVYVNELENEATRVIADGTAADLLAGGGDLAGQGWVIANGAVNRSAVLGGSRDGGLIVAGVKALGLVATYKIRRVQLGAWKACMLRVYDGANEECKQRDSAKRNTVLTTAARLLAAGWSAYQGIKAGGQ